MRKYTILGAILASLLFGVGAPAVAQEKTDPLNRFAVVFSTHQNGSLAISYSAVRTAHLDLAVMVQTGSSGGPRHEQRHYHPGIGLFTPVVGNVSFGVFSIDKGSSFGRVQYGISVRL